MRKRKVFVTGCFDLLHSGHVHFLNHAATYGNLYVCIGSDDTIEGLKGAFPVYNQYERKLLIESLKSVQGCFIGSGSGILDFIHELEIISPDCFIVNRDGHCIQKEKLCRERKIRYVVLDRIPPKGFPARSSTALRKVNQIPYRVDLAGGWFDQPLISKHATGAVLTISIEPTAVFRERSGMATSSRQRAIELWQTYVPAGDKEKLARILFSYENPPGSKYFSGSQDSIGIVYPGLNKIIYDGSYWPTKIVSIQDDETLSWIENHICLIYIGPRSITYTPCEPSRITISKIRKLAMASERCWDAILDRDIERFALYLRKSFEAQVDLFPSMINRRVQQAIDSWSKEGFGWKLAGAGGGGYLILAGRNRPRNSIRVKIRRNTML